MHVRGRLAAVSVAASAGAGAWVGFTIGVVIGALLGALFSWFAGAVLAWQRELAITLGVTRTLLPFGDQIPALRWIDAHWLIVIPAVAIAFAIVAAIVGAFVGALLASAYNRSPRHAAVVVELPGSEAPAEGYPRPMPTLDSELPLPAAIVFDLDGTLVDTVETRIHAWMAVFEEERIRADRLEVAGLIGADGRRVAREIAERAGEQLADARAEEIDRRAGEIYEELNRDPIPLPGVHDALAALDARGVRWAIATSSRAEQVGTSVAALDLDQQPMIVDGSHVDHAKPEPDLLLYAASTLGVPAERCWYVGDSTWDMMAATAAGMVGIGVPTGAIGRAELEEAGARCVIASLDRLRDLLPER
ncbi:MAG TPA: HAD family hydrolase [Candidatus Limnocylindria bacterium]|nr:HAD family hydrolase [Candidatus Limnocylindria bacterium]